MNQNYTAAKIMFYFSPETFKESSAVWLAETSYVTPITAFQFFH